MFLVTAWFVTPRFAAPGLDRRLRACSAAAILGTLGLIAGIWADKFDQIAAFQNFIIMPLTFLSGVFYSVESLPPFWQELSHLNPFFYMVDGFRYGFFGQSDISPVVSLAIVVAIALVAVGRARAASAAQRLQAARLNRRLAPRKLAREESPWSPRRTSSATSPTASIANISRSAATAATSRP